MAKTVSVFVANPADELPESYLYGVTALTTTDVWAVGGWSSRGEDG